MNILVAAVCTDTTALVFLKQRFLTSNRYIITFIIRETLTGLAGVCVLVSYHAVQ